MKIVFKRKNKNEVSKPMQESLTDIQEGIELDTDNLDTDDKEFNVFFLQSLFISFNKIEKIISKKLNSNKDNDLS